MSPTLRLVGLALAAAALAAMLVASWRAARPADLVINVEPIRSDVEVTVYVAGAVQSPGLYVLPARSRVAHAVERAGPLEQADISSVPMAAPLKDGQQIYIPSRSAGESTASVRATGIEATPGSSRRININTASVAELELLPGIGPSLASRIVEYRTANGPFPDLESLEAVRGISARMIEDLRGMATVGGD